MSSVTPSEQTQGKMTALVSLLVTGIWMVGLFTDQSWWLMALIVGYAVFVPITATIFDEESSAQDWMSPTPQGQTNSQSEEQPTDATEPDDEDTAAALDTLRDRYARGELTEEQFERKLERLLETDTVENAADYTRDRQRGETTETPADRELERE